MPSLAFASAHDAHAYPMGYTVGAVDAVDWDDIQEALKTDDAKYINVTKEPTHTETGLVNLTCKEGYCGNVVEDVVINTIGHKYVARDISIEQYATAMLEQEEVNAAFTGPAVTFANKYAAEKWVKEQTAAKKCYVKNAKVCSCGDVLPYVDDAADTSDGDTVSLEGHTNKDAVPPCTDYNCAKCGVLVKGTGHKADTTTDVENFDGGYLKTEKAVAADKVSEPVCGKGTGYKWECKDCHKKVAVVYTNDATNTAHKFGTPVDKSVATQLMSDDTYQVVTGYAAVGNNTVLVKGQSLADGKDYKFYKLNNVKEEGSCSSAKKMDLKCEVCDREFGEEELAFGHDWEKIHTAATCDNVGKNTYVCKVCGIAGQDHGKNDELLTTTEPKLDHNYKVTKKTPECGTVGVEYYVIECTTCSKTDVDGTHPYDDSATPAKVVLRNDVEGANVVDITPATADNTKTRTILWGGFDNELKGSKMIELTFDKVTTAPVHKYGVDAVVKAATCTEDEVWGKTCENCGKVDLSSTYVKYGTNLGHTVVKNEVAATCGTAGYYTEKCSTCGFVKNVSGNMVDPSTIDGTDADKTVKKTATDKALVKDGAKCTFDKWVVTKASTVFEEGVKTLTCSVCGAHDATKTVIAKKTVAKASNTVKAGKKSFNVKSSAANATGYRVYYKKAGAKSWKSYTKKTASLSKTFSGLSKGKYYVKVKAYAKNYAGDGEVVWGATSATKTVKVK